MQNPLASSFQGLPTTIFPSNPLDAIPFIPAIEIAIERQNRKPFVQEPVINRKDQHQLLDFNNPHPANDDKLFLELFQKELLEDVMTIKNLIGLGDFQANKHRTDYCECNDDECKDCYSGDTADEMANNDILGDLWKRAYAQWKQRMAEDNSDAEHDE